MKKYFILLASILLIAPCVGAQTFKRTTKTPGFFIPKGALQTGARREKLPPVEQMNYRGQQAPIVIEMQRQAQEKAKQEQIEKQKQEAFAKLKKEQENTKFQKASTSENKENETTLSQIPDNTKTKVENGNVTFDTKQNISATQKTNDIPLVEISPEDEAKFAQILAEYHNDVEAISKNTPIRNQRLINMIADFVDKDRSI